MNKFLNLLNIETESKINFFKHLTFQDKFLYTITCELQGVRFASFVIFVNKNRNIDKIEVIDAHLNHTNHLSIEPLSDHEDAFDKDVIIKNINAGFKKENIQF